MTGLHVGGYDVELLDLGRFFMDGGGMFGIVPKVLWSRAYPHVDDRNRIELAAWALLIRGNGRVIVVDAGYGDKLDPKQERNFGIVRQPRLLERALESRGVAPDDVTDFIYTHLHFDHAGGSTRRGTPLGRDGGGADAEFLPALPRARHCVQQAQLDWARSPSAKDRASFLPENWEPVVEAGLLDIAQGGVEFAPGIELRPLDGHTISMQAVIIHGEPGAADSAAGLLFAADLVPTAAHLPLHYVAAYDNLPLAVLEEKRLLLAEATRDRWIVCFGHDPFTPAAVLREGPRSFEVAGAVAL